MDGRYSEIGKRRREEIDFWTDRAEDKRTHYIDEDICEEMDRKEAEKALPPIERYIYRADREGFTQSEIARELGIDQSTVSRKLDRLYDRMNVVRLYDGERTKKELAFEVGWESFLRNRFMKNDADLWAVTFQILVGEKFLSTLHKWYYSPRELLRYSIRFLMIGGKETKEGRSPILPKSFLISDSKTNRKECKCFVCV